MRNVVGLFHVLEKELEWRKANGKPEGFETLKARKPIVAVGPEHPLEDEELMADFFREFPSLRIYQPWVKRPLYVLELTSSPRWA